MKLPKFITFDCYGTLIDFQIKKAALDMLGSRVEQLDDVDAFFQRYSDIRFNEVLGEYQPYSTVLRESTRKALTEFGLEYREEDGDAIVAAVPTWGPFPDVPPALERLGQHSKLVIISNAEDDMIAHNVRNIGVPFHDVITAEQAQSYKPSLDTFHFMFNKLGCEPGDILHVAQGFTYDIIPASKLGLKRVWINRNGREGDQEKYGPYQEFPDLNGLLTVLGV